MTEEDGLSLPKWKGKGQSHNRGAHGELRAPELGKRQMPCRQPDLSYGLGTAADQLRGSEVPRCLWSFPFPLVVMGNCGREMLLTVGIESGEVPRKGCAVSPGPCRRAARTASFHLVRKELKHFGEKVILQIFESNFTKPWALIHLL